MGILRSASGLVEDLENRRDNNVGEMLDFLSFLQDKRDEAQEMLDEVDEARNRLDNIEDDAKSVKDFVDQLPSFNGGDN